MQASKILTSVFMSQLSPIYVSDIYDAEVSLNVRVSEFSDLPCDSMYQGMVIDTGIHG